MAVFRIAWMTIVMVMRTKVALFFTFLFPCIFLFVYGGIFAHGNPHAISYMFGQVLTLNILGAGFFGLGLQSVMQRERGTLRRYRLTPVGSLTIVTSNLLANYLIQVPVFLLLVLFAMGVFHMPLRLGLLPVLWFLMTVGIFSFAGFGLTLASVSNTMQEVQVYNNLAWFALVFLSGITIPLPVLPHWVQTVAKFLPATYLVSAFQAVMSRAESLSAHLPEMVVLIISGFAGLFIAWKLFRWEKEERIPTSGKLWSLALLIPVLLMGFWMIIFADPEASWTKSYAMMNLMPPGSTGSAGALKEKVLLDFEKTNASQDLTKDWKVSANADSAGELSLISPGANGSQHALRFHGHLGASSREEAFAEIQSELILPPASSGIHEIEFWIRGDDSRAFQITVVGAGSSQDANPEIRLEPSHEWESVRIPVPQLTGSPASTTPGLPVILTIKALGAQGDFSLDIDELKTN